MPDSILKELSYSLQSKDYKNHIIATNEGAAVSLGIGQYLSTKNTSCLYAKFWFIKCVKSFNFNCAQKSLFNTFNFAYRLERFPGIKDEPQHNVKGKITRELLKLLNMII